MKKLFTLLLLLACINTSFAQIIFSEDFDGIPGPTAGGAGTYTFPSGWLLRNVDNRTPHTNVSYVNEAWERREDFGGSVIDSIAFSTSWYTPEGSADDWMWTPPITITAQCELSWNAKAYDPLYPDGYEVRIMVSPDSPTGGTGVMGNQVTNSTVLFSTVNESTSWVHRTADLTAYEGQTVRIAFRNNTNNLFLLAIDDVMVQSLLDYDAGITAHSKPSEYTQIPLAQNFEFIASATINNSATQNLTSLTLKTDIYNSDNNLVFTTSETVNGTYAPGSNTVITSSTPFAPSDTGQYNIEYSVQTVPPDQRSVNDSAFDSFFISDSVFARDRGDITGSLGIGNENHPGYVGQHYVLNEPAVLTSVSIYMTGLQDEANMKMAVFGFDNGLPTTLLYQTPESFAGPYVGWITFDIPGGLALDADTFVVTGVELDSILTIGQTSDIFTSGSTWVDWPTNPFGHWANNEDFGPGFQKPYMIRANFFENFAPDFIAVTSDTSIGVCANPVISVLDGLLQVTDEDDDQTLTWDIATAPQFGTVSGFPFSTATTGGTVIPSGLGYTPNPGYEDYDTIRVSVSDGHDTDTIRVIINAGDPEPGTTWYLDMDEDGYYGDSQSSCESPGPGYTQVELADEDCDDNDPDVHPGVVTDLCDGVDNDCDGNTDEDFVGATSCITCQSGVVTDDTPTWYLDADADGYYTGSPLTQCDDPGLGYTTATPLGGNDCDDEDDTRWISVTYYLDHDGDGYDAGNQVVCQGEAMPPDYTTTTLGDDCDDDNAAVHPGAIEIIDGIDNDCNGVTDGSCTDSYYTAIAVNNPGSVQTDYQVLVVVNTQNLVSVGHMQADGDDIRFYSSSCSGSSFQYYIESGMNTTETHIWVNVPSVPGGSSTLYMNYGDGSASAVADFDATFPDAMIIDDDLFVEQDTIDADWFQINAGKTLTLSTGDPVVINARRALINGNINGNGQGYQSAASGSNGNGPGAGTISSTSNSGSGGGSYGGVGGTGGYDPDDLPGVGGTVYGTAGGIDINLGSSGGSTIFGQAGAGGGALTLNVEVLDINGNVSVNGNAGAIDFGGLGSGGGSGGGIVVYTDQLIVNGAISSDGGGGGNGSGANDGGGGGGGGRVKINYQSLYDVNGTITANGGAGGGGGSAATGQNGQSGSLNEAVAAYYVVSTTPQTELACGSSNEPVAFQDLDGDGYGNPDVAICEPLPGYVADSTDCNDNNSLVHAQPVISFTPEERMVCHEGNVEVTAAINTYYFEGNLLGGNSVPPVETTGSGNYSATFDASTGQITLDLLYSNLLGTATDGHIHMAPVGVNGPVIIPFTGFTTGSNSGAYSATLTVPPANVADLLAGNTYINIHSTAYPAGEIRGQLNPGTINWQWSLGPTTPTINLGAGTYTVSATYYGCTGTADVTVLEDTVKPIAECQNITIQLGEDGIAEISSDDIDDDSYDNCSIESISVDPVGFSCAELGDNTVTLTVTDRSGNVSTCTAIVTVADTINPEFLTGPSIPDPELFYYNFNGSGTSVPNLASSPPSGTSTATIMGGLSLGSEGLCGSALVGTGGSSTSDYLNTGWAPNLTGSWTVSFWAKGNYGTSTLYYVFGDIGGASFRCFTNGVAGPGNWILRGGFTDIIATGGATSGGTITTFVYDEPNSNIKAYVNGTLVSTVAQGGVTMNGPGPLKVMGYSTAVGSPEGGLIDEFRMYDRALSVEEVQELATICEMVAGCPESITTTADPGVCTAAVDYDNPLADDNCEDVTITQTAGLPSGSDFPVGTTTNTFTATDASGNVSTCSFDVIVTDDQNPTALCHNITAYLDEDGAVTITGEDVDNGSSDACGIASLSVSPDNFDCDNVPSEGNLVTLTVTDENGNTSTCTANITVRDTIDPVAICQDITVQLDGEGVAEISGEDIDNGSTDACGIESVSVNPSVFDCEDVGTNTVTLTVTDVHGNTSTCEATVTVEDDIDPDASCQNVTVSLNGSGTASVTAEQVDDGSGDACGIESMSVSPNTFTCDDVGDNTVTLTVTDVNGNSSTCEATVIVEDNTNPVAVCQNITVQLNGEGVAEISGNDIDNGSSDVCGIQSLSLSQAEFDCSDIGINTVILTVTDVNGNTAGCETTVTVEDNVDPVAVCRNVTIVLNEGGTASVSSEQVNDGSSDACGIESMSVSPNTFSCEDVGENTVTLTVTDVNGNSSTCDATVTVEDNTNPVALCHNITVQLDENGEATITGADIDNGSSDLCGIESLSVSPNTFDCDDVDFESNPVTLTVTDVNGNTATCTANVNVQDTIDPVAVCQAVTIQLNENGNSSVTAAQVNNGSSDACGIASMSVSPAEFSCNDVGANTVTLTVTDVNGNTSSCETTVTVEDNVAPDAVCQNVTIQLDENGSASVDAEDLDDGSTDACGIESVSVSNGTFGCDDVGDNTVTITVTDVNGNSSTCEAVVTVEDNTNPVAVCQAVTLQLDATGNAVLDAADVDNGSSDICGIAGMTVTPNEFNCSDIGANSVMFTVTDVNGNSSSCEASVTVEDNVDPVAACQAVTIQLDENGEASVSTEPVNNGSSDACGIASMSLDQTNFDCADLGANTVTLTVTDNNGNSSTCTATVTVEDDIDPVAVCQGVTIQLDANGAATLNAADLDDGSTDNCGIASMTVDVSSFDCQDVGENVVTFTVTDNGGNTDACTATVTVEDNVDPVLICQNITAELDENGDVTITAADLDNGSSDACGIASFSASRTSFSCADLGANAVVLSVTDNNGNTSSCEATVTVEDNTDPVLTVPGDITACSSDEDGAVVSYEAPSFTDNCSAEITQTAGFESGEVFPVGVTTNTFEVTDAGGNTVTASFTVTVSPPPVADFTVTNACSDSQISFENTSTVSSGTIDEFDWDFGDGESSADENPSHQFATDSTYSVTLTITTDGGCTASVTHDVTPHPVPTFTYEVTNVSCNGLSDGVIVVVINNGAGPFYHSVNGGPEQELNTFAGLPPANYTIVSRNEHNCTYTQTVSITQPAPLAFSVTGSTGVACEGEPGGSVTLLATGGTMPYHYYIDGGEDHPSGVLPATGGTHTVTVADANNCTISGLATVPVLVGLPFANFIFTIDGLNAVFTNTSTGGDTYLWHFGDGPYVTSEDATHTFPPNGNYNVSLIAFNECGSDTIVLNLGIMTGIENPDEDGYTINLFPNPNNGSFTMMLQSSGYMDELNIRLFTVEGKLIDDSIVAVGGNSYTRNFNYDLAAGLYVLEVRDGSHVSHQRVVVK